MKSLRTSLKNELGDAKKGIPEFGTKYKNHKDSSRRASFGASSACAYESDSSDEFFADSATTLEARTEAAAPSQGGCSPAK